MIETVHAWDDFSCAFSCLRVHNCFSFNFKRISQACELIHTNRLTSLRDIIKDFDSNYHELTFLWINGRITSWGPAQVLRKTEQMNIICSQILIKSPKQSKIPLVLLNFALTGPENSRYLNQSDSRLKTVVIWSLEFSCISCGSLWVLIGYWWWRLSLWWAVVVLGLLKVNWKLHRFPVRFSITFRFVCESWRKFQY